MKQSPLHSPGFWPGVICGSLITLALTAIIAISAFSLGISRSSTADSPGEHGPSAGLQSSESIPTDGSESSDLKHEETDSPSTSAGNDKNADKAAPLPSDTWDSSTVYTGGDTVSYQGKMYKCRWWTQGDAPGSAVDGPWEDLLVADPKADQIKQPEHVENVPIAADTPQRADAAGFKVVGYYPSWAPDQLGKVDFNIVTHVNYAFAIPNSDGTLKPLENPQTAKALIDAAHKSGAKALIAVGGWSYNGTPLEPAFMSATDTAEKREKFVGEIMKLCSEMNFDGVDMDWEHPRVDGNSAAQYEATMELLAQRLHKEGKLLTSAVLSGATPDGNIYYDAAAHTNAVLNCVDWINVMAYDGGDGERHSSYDFAVSCGSYWKDTRGLPAAKVVLGVPFYGRPSWGAYGKILEADPSADQKDVASFNGMEAHYNGIPTIEKKTAYAKKNLGGMMIWELTQDTADKNKSLLQAIGKSAK